MFHSDVFWEIEGDKLRGSDGRIYTIWPSEFWYVVPTLVDFEPEVRIPRPLDFAYVRHNASIANGLLCAASTYVEGVMPGQPYTTLKRGAARDAEMLLEQIRLDEFPELPSRLCCYFLSVAKDHADFRLVDSLRGDGKRVEPCYVVRDHGKFHLADSKVYEQLEGRPDDAQLARKYWSKPAGTDIGRMGNAVELLADSSLFFPEWRSFEQLDLATMEKWQNHVSATQKPVG